MVLSTDPLIFLRKCDYQTNSKQKQVVSMKQRALPDIDVGLFELPMFVFKQDDEGDEDERKQEEGRGRESMLLNERINEERYIS